MLRIFLAHAKEDKDAVTQLYHRLKESGYRPWLDKEDLLPGQNWRAEIPKAIKNSQVFIACLSQQSVVKQGYVQREFKMALNEYANKPPDSIYLIPVRLDDCAIPELRQEEYGVNLRDIQWVDLFEANGFGRLVKALQHGFPDSHASQLPIPSAQTAVPFHASPKATTAAPTLESRTSPPSFTAQLGGGVTLEMVKIPGGRFWMGSPENELERRASEGPQHKVAVPSFYMGKYPVTQRQWLAVSLLDDVERALKPMLSHFKGDNRPVEKVSWLEAVEFCQRLSRHTGQDYRLPSEAEWEYACRAGTTTPFHFGETITTDLANYCGEDREFGGTKYSGSYGTGLKGEYRAQTTDVGGFPHNRFGLHDMHGSVWEWCQDDWHSDYQGAPIDGSAWTKEGNATYRVVRGGAWSSAPRDCRSAIRSHYPPGNRYNDIGFRVSCSAPRTLI
ncbi:MAG: SUMF1/EgtB/PvdO family nonheme iron enzyme [Cyanobacteria bacterium J06634_5]